MPSFRKLISASLSVLLSAALHAADVDEILEGYYEAQGGLEKLRELQSLRISGVNRFQQQEISAKYLAMRPNLLRMESASPEVEVVRVFDGETAWQAVRQRGSTARVVRMEGQEAVELIRESDFDGALVDYREKGHTIELVGIEKVRGSEAYKLEVVEQGGVRETYFIDTNTYRIVKKATDVPAEGGTILFEMYYDDFREVDGLVFPFTTTAVSSGQTVFTGLVEEVEVNPELDPELFERP